MSAFSTPVNGIDTRALLHQSTFPFSGVTAYVPDPVTGGVVLQTTNRNTFAGVCLQANNAILALISIGSRHTV